MSALKAAVVIPFYKTTISAYEMVSLKQCFKVLAGHHIIAVKPQNLALPAEVTTLGFSEVIIFDDAYFKGIAGYNRLMLSANFYAAFLAYEYILIHQLDAFVFRDELSQWCSKNIDYVGPPWIATHYRRNKLPFLSARLQYLVYRYLNKHQTGLGGFHQLENLVGNGGFSLRRVKPFHRLCTDMAVNIAAYNAHTGHIFNEDVFWSVEVKRSSRKFSIPGYKEALQFAFEIAPEYARILNNGQLPFGCHAWDLNADYWRPVFKQYGYEI